jgi:hypothetical protein
MLIAETETDQRNLPPLIAEKPLLAYPLHGGGPRHGQEHRHPAGRHVEPDLRRPHQCAQALWLLERSRSQLVFYQPGVGTFGLNGWWRQLKSKTRIIMGLATGAGISDNVMQAYEFLVENWEFGDRIYVLGFSRGAYTARLLTGFIRIFGLVRREQLHLLRYAWRAYTRLGQPGSKDFSAEIGHFQKVLGGHGIRIEFHGPLGHGGLGV